MRTITKIISETKIESDVDDEYIYCFPYAEFDIIVLVRKGNQFFWKHLGSTKMVWYAMYDTIEKAIEGVMELKEYKKSGGPIMEFGNTEEFIYWANGWFREYRDGQSKRDKGLNK